MELRDEQQALVVERLRAANGAPVSFAELRDMGVENPALLCYELAAVGLPVERQRTRHGASSLTLAVRLEDRAARVQPPLDVPHGGADLAAQERMPGGVADSGLGDRRRGSASSLLTGNTLLRSLSLPRRLDPRGLSLPRPSTRSVVAAGVVLAVLVGVGAMALALRGGAAKTTDTLGAEHAQAHSSARTLVSTESARSSRRSDRPPASQPATGDRSSSRPGAPRPSSARSRPAVPVSATAAAAFEAEGHQLLMSGRYAAAIGALRDAIRASGGSLASCSQPTTEACLTYAYALYDLGRALQLNGDPAAAIPVLNQRLRIDNQREVVEQALELARRATA